jgi:succinate-acetate transporter protein
MSVDQNFPPPRVFLRPIGSPLTIGMAGLAIASLVQSGLDLHWLAPTQSHDVGLILITVPFILQLLACVFSYLARDGATGAAVGVLSATWLSLGLVHLTSTPGSRSGALGLMLLTAGAMLCLSAIASVSAKPLPALVFTLAGLRFLIAGIYELGAISTWQHAAGIVGLVICGIAGYCVLAFELEDQQHRPVLPTFRRGRGRLALLGDPAQRVDGVSSEAGVRQTV